MIEQTEKIKPRVNSPVIGPLPSSQFGSQLNPGGRAAAYELLSSPRRLTNTVRKSLKRALERHLVTSLESPIAPEVKLARKLTGLPLRKLHSFQNRFARRASTALHVLSQMDPTSPFVPATQRQQVANLGAFKQVNAEIEARAIVVQPDFRGFK